MKAPRERGFLLRTRRPRNESLRHLGRVLGIGSLLSEYPTARLRTRFQQPRTLTAAGASGAAGDHLVRDLSGYDRAFGLNAHHDQDGISR